MGKLAAFLVVSADGYYEGRSGEFDWPNVDLEFNDFAVRQLEASDILLFGRKTYEGMAAYWPTPQAQQDDQAVSSLMNSLPKIVVSRTLDRPEPDWHNTRLIRGDAQEIGALKRQGTKDLLILGSSTLVTGLMLVGQLDELRLLVNPIILGAGKSVFLSSDQRIGLTLLAVRSFKSGNVLLTYRPIAQPAARADPEPAQGSIPSTR